MRKQVVAMMVASVMMLCHAGDSAPFVLDNATSPSGESVVLPWNAEWIGGNANATVAITDNGTEVKRTTGSGEFTLNISLCGEHKIEYSTYINGVKQREVYTAVFMFRGVRGNHVGVITKPAVEPTSSTEGKTAEITCTRCGEILQAQTTIPALGYIRNVTARQLWPHKKVEVCYDVAEDIGDVLDLEQTLTIMGQYGSSIVAAQNIIGDMSCTPGLHRVIWDMDADGLSINADSMTFEVADDVKVPGFVTKTFSSSSLAFDKTSDVWSGSSTVVTSPSQIYATSLAEHTTVAYGCYMQMSAGVTYEFKGCYDDFVGVKVGTSWIVGNSAECKEASGSFTPSETGFYKVEFRVGNNGGQGGCRNSSQYGIQWRSSANATWRNIANTDSETVFFSSIAGNGSETVSGVSPAIAVNTSPSVKNGMEVSFAVNLGYSPFANGEVTIEVDGVAVLSSANSGTFTWQPRTTGIHTLKHISGSSEWTRTVNVTETVASSGPSPSPPTDEDANISIGTTSKSFSADGGSGSIATAGSGTWAASVSDDWITIPASLTSRNAGLPVTYTVAASTKAEDRTGYVYVSGHVYTITQAGVGAELDSNAADFEAEGGSGSFTVLASGRSTWTAWSNVDWISVVPTSGEGEAEVLFTVAPLNSVSTRTGTITAAGQTFTVKQTGRRMKLYVADAEARIPPVAERDYLSHVIDVQVNALSSTEWAIFIEDPWVSVVDAGTGHGGGSVALAIAENPSYLARSSTVIIGTDVLTIRQGGRPTSALSFALSPVDASASVDGANGLLSVAATPDLPWTVKSGANWLTVMPSFQSGAGNGNVVYTVSPNTTLSARSGQITVTPEAASGLGAETHTVSQPAAVSFISVASHMFAPAGESFDVEVSVSDVVGWTVSENCDWVSIGGGLSRNGPGTVSVVAAANPSVDAREAKVTIAGHSFSVVQPGRSVELEHSSMVFGCEDGYATIGVHPDGDVQWTATVSDPTWITIWAEGCDIDSSGNVIGVGDATLEYALTAYVGDGTPRTGWITIGGSKVYITQRAYDLSISPSASSVSGNAGAGEVSVPASVGEVWNAIATEPWITIVSGYDSGTGSGTVRFNYTENATGVSRTGRIVISGEEYTITQASRQLVKVTATASGAGGTVSGGGTYDRGANVLLRAVANDGYEFVGWTRSNGETSTKNPLTFKADVDRDYVAAFNRVFLYVVNGETVRGDVPLTFTAPAPIVDSTGTTQLVCRGSSVFPDKGASFTLTATSDLDFEWDMWETNYWLKINAPSGGSIRNGSSSAASCWVPAGDTINLAARANSGKTFFRWTGDVAKQASGDETIHLVMDGAKTLGAVFGNFVNTLPDSADATGLVFRTGGDAPWTPVVDATATKGYSSVRSGAIEAESETWLETALAGPGTLSFRWKADCEHDERGFATWDRLSVFTNGVEAARIDGKTDWQAVSLPIGVGATKVRWSFYRDDWDDGDDVQNCGWVDNVIWTGKEGE